MSRKDMFAGIVPQKRDEATTRTGFSASHHGPVAAIGMELRNASGRSIIDIDPAQIDEGRGIDRMEIRDEDVRDLRESILKVGQQVPILVRPSQDGSDRYEVIYGRRRLKAMRGLDRPIRCLVRVMSDEEVTIAQGQENALRVDPSFIERALFARTLLNMGYSQTAVSDAIAIERSSVSRMVGILNIIPDDLIQAIGPAPGIGRGSWTDLAAMLRDADIPMAEILTPDLQDQTSEKRFQTVFRRISERKRARQKTPSRTIVSAQGAIIGEVKAGDREVSLKIDRRKTPEFGAWLDQNAQEILRRLHNEFTGSEPPRAQ